MKHCPTCGRDFPDKYRFCQYDRTVLVEVLGQQAVAVGSAVTSLLDSAPVQHEATNGAYPTLPTVAPVTQRLESSAEP